MKTKLPSTCLSVFWLALMLPCPAGKIHDAVTKRDLAALEKALKEDPEQINSRSYPDFTTPLYMAVAGGDPGLVERLIDAGADLTAPEVYPLPFTPLQRAVMFVNDHAPDGKTTAEPDPLNPPLSHRSQGSRESSMTTGPQAAIEEYARMHGAMPVAEREARLKVLALLLATKPELNKGFRSGVPPLHLAANLGIGNAHAVELLLRAGSDANGRSDTWATPLHGWAILGRERSVCDLLVAAGANVDAGDKSGQTPLMYAAKSGSLPAVEALLAHGAAVDAEDIQRRTALHFAVQCGNDAVVRKIYQAGGSDLIRWGKPETLFRSAALHGNKALTEILLAEGIDINIRDSSGFTPLLTAVGKGHRELTRMLLDRNADQNARTTIRDETGATPLLNVGGNHPDLARFLIGKGADRTAKSRNGISLFSVTCFGKNTAIAKELLAENIVKPGDPNLLTDASIAGCVELVKVLIDQGADVNAVNKNGITPLENAILGFGVARDPLVACSEDDFAEVVELLLHHGAKVNPSVENRLPLVHLAAMECGARVMKALLKADGGTPLHGAVFSNSLECVRPLLAAGADPNAVDSDHLTALTLAIDIKDLPKPTESKEDQRFYQRVTDLLSRLRIIHDLIETGASTTAVPAEYNSLIGYAQDRGCPEIVEILENPPHPKSRKP